MKLKKLFCMGNNIPLMMVMITWVLSTIPSFTTMLYVWLSGSKITNISILGISSSDILIYSISFSAAIIAYFFIECLKMPKNIRTKLVWITVCSLSVWAFATILFSLTRSYPENKESYVLWISLSLYVATIILWICHSYITYNVPGMKEQENIDKIYDENMESSFDKKLKEVQNDQR